MRVTRIGCPLLALLACLGGLAGGMATPSGGEAAQAVQVVPATESLLRRASQGGETMGKLLKAARPTIGVPYHWGGTRLEKGIDCSNYTWQLYRSVGLPYDRFRSTMSMSYLRRDNGLRRVTFQEAMPGDLLVYGYRDAKKRWHGHVVILVDKDGKLTGHKGLVLGAHGGEVGEVQFVTFKGFEEGYFKEPEMRLCNVLRVEEAAAVVDP